MKFGRYHVIEELGKGAMGVVYKAHDPEIDRIIALKVLREDRLTSDAYIQRFLKEAKAIGRLSHPNIVTVYDVGSDHGTIFIAEEFVDGKPLDEILKQGKLEIKDIVAYGVQMANALHYAHNKGIVHRDIKPSNMIVTPEGNVKITDFGIAHIENLNAPELTQAGEILGTPYYISPEQLTGQNIDGRSDIFSLGVILYEMATGNRPFKGKSLPSVFLEIIEKVPTFPNNLECKCNDRLAEIISKALEKNADNRYFTGEELSEALKSLVFDGLTDTIRKPVKKRKKSLISLIAVLLSFLFVSGIIGYMLFPKPQAILKLESEPEGAQIFLNGDLKGLTPLDLQVPLGKYELRLSKQNFYEWEEQIQVEKQGTKPIFVKLNPLIF